MHPARSSHPAPTAAVSGRPDAGARAARDGDAGRLTVEIADPAAPDAAERAALIENCRRHGFSLYRFASAADAEVLSRFAAAMGLRDRDRTIDADDNGVAAIRADAGRAASGFIPYSARALNWHTDGYYLAPPRRVRAVVMHCARPAARGGASELLDPVAIHAALGDLDPRFPAALARPDAFTIPARDDASGEARAAVTGPVFTREPVTGALHMRYTARTRSIEWSSAPEVQEAHAALRELIETPPVPPLAVLLAAGEGIICNNVLHRREAFTDDSGGGRLLYRIRSSNRVGGT